jgi:biopolymer transport protein ExbD
MKLSLFKSVPLPSEAAEDNEIDIAPVMNMFVILVTFLISMTVFTHTAILEFSLPPNVGAGLDQSKGKPKLKLMVRIGTDYVGIVMGDKLLDSLGVSAGVFPFAELKQRLEKRHSETEIQDQVVIASTDAIAFKQVVRVMDICRETGFSDIGLSSATVHPGKGE